MGYRLQMSAEIRDWLAELRDSDPPAASAGRNRRWLPWPRRARASGRRWSLPRRTGQGPKTCNGRWTGAIRPGWNRSTGMRRRMADAVTLRRDIERQIAELQSQAA